MTPEEFRTVVWRHYRRLGRHDLPWRGKRDLYSVLVAEVMLQQTQVERVAPLYTAFLRRFPTAKRLASAPLSRVVRAWQGLGYNRRAKMLHQAAKALTATRFDPRDCAPRSNLVAELEALPGVGPYTARAVATFAHNLDGIVIETNIRTAVIHHFFPRKQRVSDKEIERVLARALPKGRAREWYSALMDYGAALKRSGVSHNARSVTHTKQPKFQGSLREVRGRIIRELAQGPATKARLQKLFDPSRAIDVERALTALVQEQLVRKERRSYQLAD